MELPGSVGSADFVRPTNNKGQETVTLISYNSNKFKPKENSDRGYIHRFVQNQATNNYVVSSNAATSQCKKFNFRQGFRKRSKSASRLEENLKGSRSASVSQTNLADLDDTITYRKDTQQDLHQNLSRAESSQVQLVGFSQCNSEFAGTSNQNSSLVVDREKSSNHNSRFQTLKTSREVKMERERLRQEKLHRLTQETKEWFDRMKSERNSPSRLALTSQEERQRFFDETRERIFQSRLDDPFGQFVREHQERFAALTASIMGDSVAVGNVAALEVGKPAKAANGAASPAAPIASVDKQSETSQVGEGEQQPSAADLVASILNGTELSKKQIRKSSSSSKITNAGSVIPATSSDNSSKVRTIEIKRESVQRSNSGSSDTSSGFGSLNNSDQASAATDIIKSKLDIVNPNPVTKLQLLQERRNKLSTEHHPSFANHFGFAARYRDLNNRNNLQRRVMTSVNNKMAVTKSKSTIEYSKDSQTYRFSSEELTLASYGDSETESDDEDVDFENLDSVSIVAARASSSSSSTSSTSSSSNGLIRSAAAAVVVRAHGASPSLDSGRGDSPESSCNSTLVLTPNSTQSNTSPKKPPRPISAVPSEYSDVSTSSCRTSDEGEEQAEVKEATVTVSINPPSAIIPEKIVAEANQQDEPVLSKEARMARVFRVASELLSTEEQYVTVLYLIDQIFHFRVDQENRLSNLFPQEVLPQMFANIKSIYKFHAEFLLPQLRERMELWHTEESYQRIGDVIVKFSPFFKMYTEYVKNFDNAIHTINTTYAKNAKFAAIMDDIHAMPECGNLSLQHHMLTPIQRIPRYEILLKEYLKKLPEDSPDKADSEKALHLVSTAATHANDAMKRIEKFKKLLEVQESLGGTVDLVSPTRELLKEGKIVKISARSGDHQDRYLFLFSDLLLLCSARLITNRVISGAGPAYRLRAKFEVDNMQILEGDNLVTANTFYIRDDHKSVELYTQTRREKEEWLEGLFDAIKELYQRKSSLRIGREILRPCDSEIGKKQPHILKLDAIHKCMECTQPFSMMRKKYNCRACGIVVCAKCSGQKQPLAFEDNKPCRVCKSCHQVITSRSNESSEPPTPPTTQIVSKDTMDVQVRPKGLLEIPATCECIQSGYLLLKSGGSGGGSKPVKRWFALLPDFVLYSFKSAEACEALTATPIPGHTVMGELRSDSFVPDKEKDKTLKLFYVPNQFSSNNNSSPVPVAARKTYYLIANSKQEIQRWTKVLKLASKAELPSLDETNQELVSTE